MAQVAYSPKTPTPGSIRPRAGSHRSATEVHFPIRLVGIARMAAESNVLDEKRRVEYRSLATRKWLNRCQSERVPFDWTINPYRGCEFGCQYCYARYTHEFLERRDPEAFETEIYAKDWDAPAFADELKAVRPGQMIGLGTATDPYQPAERKFLGTQNMLRGMLALRGVSIYLTTKSDLVSRDAELLRALAEHNRVHVTLTVTTVNPALARLTEPFAPHPERRMRAVRELAAAGVSVGVMASPILPLITDSEENLVAVAQEAKRAGAHRFGAYVLFLQPAAQRVFFAFLAQQFPEYLARYKRNYQDSAYLQPCYTDRMKQLVASIRERVGFEGADWDVTPPPGTQMALFGE